MDEDQEFQWPESMKEATYDNACAIMSAARDTMALHVSLLGNYINVLDTRRKIHPMFYANVGKLKSRIGRHSPRVRDAFLRAYFKALVTR